MLHLQCHQSAVRSRSQVWSTLVQPCCRQWRQATSNIWNHVGRSAILCLSLSDSQLCLKKVAPQLSIVVLHVRSEKIIGRCLVSSNAGVCRHWKNNLTSESNIIRDIFMQREVRKL